MKDTEKYTYLLVQDGYHIMDENDKLLTAEELCIKLEQLQDTANLWQCMQEAGIDNVEAYSQGYQLYYERYPEKDEWA